MGFNPPVPQQDSNWEIRAAVVLSLFFQVLIIFLGPTRKRSSAPLFRLTVWSSYLLTDWVADLGLGLLLNNMGNIGASTTGSNVAAGSSSSPIIFAFWTPFLLLHLGGPDTITAYSVEDNELWNRHLIGLLFELFSAFVIIFCSLRNNPLVPATMLMLVAGVIKYGERTYSLYYGSNLSLRDSILGPPEPGPNYPRLMTEFDSKERAGLPVELAVYEAQELEITQEEWLADILRVKSLEARAFELFLIFRRLLVDVIISFKERRLSQALFLKTESEAFEVMELELNFMYDMVYTKAPVAHSKAGWVLRCLVSGCLVSTLVIFFFVDKNKPGHQIQRVDIGITYALLLGALVLDAVAVLMLVFSDRTKVYLEEFRWLAWLRQQVTKRWQTSQRRWSGTVSQMNLIRYCREKPAAGPYSKCGNWLWLMIAKMLGIEDTVGDLVFIRRARLKKDGEEDCRNEEDSVAESHLLGFMFRGLRNRMEQVRTKDAVQEKDAIAELCKRRGDGVIKSHEGRIIRQSSSGSYKVILDSVTTKDFDESLLMWHIATDLRRYRGYETVGDAGETMSVRPVGPHPNTVQMQAIGETLSEYMLYLLIKQPDMLSATAGIGLLPYRDTCAQARRFFASKEPWLGIDKEDGMRIFLLNVNTTENRPVTMKGDRSKSVLFDAVILGKALRELDEVLMWELVAGIWGEMMSFAAVSGRGRTHMRNLNRGGELITFVWLLMQHLCLSDMYEIQQGDLGVQLIVHY